MPERPLRLGFITGEESGDLLAAELVRELSALSGRPVELVGVGGRHLENLGLKTLFSPQEIALMGVGAVLAKVPRLFKLMGGAVEALSQAQLDALITVDVPDFSLRVAKRFRQRAKGVPIVHYVCPSVWAWRPGRAPAMRAFVDHVLCQLPFEPEALQRLGGPRGTYVGHRLTHDRNLATARDAQAKREAQGRSAKRVLLLLPGSRRSEVMRLLPDFRETVELLRERGLDFRLLLPTVPHAEALVRDATSGWVERPQITTSAEDMTGALSVADAALCASGTVSLELALAGIPHISCYRFDVISRRFRFLIRTWSANLPNLIADRTVVTESYDEMIRPGNLARYLEALAAPTKLREWQKEGFDLVRQKMAMPTSAGRLSAQVVLSLMRSL